MCNCCPDDDPIKPENSPVIMTFLSKLSLTLFEIANELHIAFGAGIIGLGALFRYGVCTKYYIRCALAASLSIGSFIYVYQISLPHCYRNQPSEKKVILITGCDSGLGYSLARHCADIGFTVIAGFLDINSNGAIDICEKNGKQVLELSLDITVTESILEFLQGVDAFFYENPEYELYAVINNAGVMIFGEFEWLTDQLIAKQLDINLFGTMRFSKAFIPLLRMYKGRLINVISHCAQCSLPGLAVYGATKAGVAAFSDSLRIELSKFDVPVIQLIPGSFLTSSNIMCKHNEYVRDMSHGFTEEQHQVYDDYFTRYNQYLSALSTCCDTPQMIDNPNLYCLINDALLSSHPKALYKTEPFRYAWYHFLFKISPTCWRDYFVKRFMQMPEYNLQVNV